MRPALAAAAALAALSAPLLVTAQGQPYDKPADWLQRPSKEEVDSVRPTAAVREGLDGRATLKCLVTVEGALTNCTVLEEHPAGKGFGGAALTLAPRFKLRPATKAGKPVESWVSIPISMTGEGGKKTDSFIKGGSTMGMVRQLRAAPWTSLPTFEQMAAAYPAKAKAAGKTGRVVVHCRFTKQGTLTGCNATSEEPGGMGFGAAAKQLIATFQAPDNLPELGPIANVEIDVPFTFNQDLLDSKRRPMSRPVWISQPNDELMREVFPAKALSTGVGKGLVILGCTIGPQGDLTDCRVTKEEPVDLGFGQAALTASRAYRVRSWTEEGLPTAGQAINLAVGYDLPPAELAAIKGRRSAN